MFATLLALGMCTSVAGVGRADAQSVEGAQAEAQALADELAATRSRLIDLAEDHNRASADLEAAQRQVADNQALLDQQQADLDAARERMRDYAVQAYIGGGSMRNIDALLGSDKDTADRRLNYLDVAAGDEARLIDQIGAADAQVTAQLGRLQQAEQLAAAEQARIDQARQEAGDLEATTARLLDEANGRLATLVAEAEARRVAEEERAAEEERQRQVVQQAARQAAAPAETESAPAVSTGSGQAQPARSPAPAYTPPPGIRPEAAIALSAAMSQLGVPYVWGGSSPSQGFDCSGLVYWAYAQAGIRLSRPADYQRDDSIRISYEDLQPGDLVFYGEPPSHVGIYVGNDQILNAPQTGDVVSVKNMFYSSKPMTYGRVG